MGPGGEEALRASVIIPTYDRVEYLREALDSAAKQTMPAHEYEVIVASDGSPSVTRRQIEAWWKGRGQLRVLMLPHRGLSATFNTAAAVACGEYLTVLPDDDRFLPNKLSLLVSELDANQDCGMAFSRPKYIDANGARQTERKKPALFVRENRVVTKPPIAINSASTLYRRSLFDAHGGWLEELPMAEEYEWHLRLLRAGVRFLGVNHYTCECRLHRQSKSSSNRTSRKRQYRHLWAAPVE